jgi:hypothetical protein
MMSATSFGCDVDLASPPSIEARAHRFTNAVVIRLDRIDRPRTAGAHQVCRAQDRHAAMKVGEVDVSR